MPSTKPSARRKTEATPLPPSPRLTKRNLFSLFAISAFSAVALYYLVPSVLPGGSREAFAVRNLPGRGKGLIATRDIKRGELIIREEPLILVPSEVTSSPEELISSLLKSLPPKSQSAFLSLSHVPLPPSSSPQTTALAIFQTNAISAGSHGVGLFPTTARMNHACAGAFNSVYNWREHEGRLVVHVFRDIRQGEEILTAYTDTKRPRAVRQKYLKDTYAFTCTCPVCSLPEALSSESDKRLSEITALQARLTPWSRGAIGGVEAMAIVRNIWTLADEEGYFSERGRLFADATWIAAAHSDGGAARAWATLAAEWFGYELGGDAPQVVDMAVVAGNPSAHSAWGSREFMVVGGPGLRE